jgi:hypothetical protein
MKHNLNFKHLKVLESMIQKDQKYITTGQGNFRESSVSVVRGNFLQLRHARHVTPAVVKLEGWSLNVQ